MSSERGSCEHVFTEPILTKTAANKRMVGILGLEFGWEAMSPERMIERYCGSFCWTIPRGSDPFSLDLYHRYAIRFTALEVRFWPSSLPPQTRRPSAVHQLNHYLTHHTTFVALSKRDTQDPIIEPLQRFKSEEDTAEEQNFLGGQIVYGDDDDVLRRIEEEQRAQEALKENRFSHWSVRGYAYTETDHIEVSVLNWLDVNDNPHRRQAWSGPGVVWVGLDPDGNVLFQDWPEHYKEPIRTSSTKLIELDLSDRLEIFEKCHRLHETARCFQLAEDAGHITRHEAQLIVDFDACYIEGLHLLEHKKMLPGANQWPDPLQQQLQGKEIFADLQKCYGATRFPCIETVIIAAKYLDNMWDDANNEGWWMLSDSKFLDIFLMRMHKFMWRTHGPAKHRQTIYNLPLASYTGVFVEEGLEHVFEWDRDAKNLGRNVVRTRDRLKALAAASPIAAAACRAEIRRPKGLAREGTDERFTPILEPAQESSISLLQFRQWLEIFYQNSDKARTLPTELEPLAITEKAGSDFDTAGLLETIADLLAPYSHYTLVQMVWRDLLIPAAVEGDVQELINHGGHLVLMIQGEKPLVHSHYTLKALINHRDPLDEEDYPSDVELYDAVYNNIDPQGPRWHEQW